MRPKIDAEKVILCNCIGSAASVPAGAGSFQFSSGDPVRFVGVAGQYELSLLVVIVEALPIHLLPPSRKSIGSVLSG